MAVRSDGRERRKVIDSYVRSVDLGSTGRVYAVVESFGSFDEFRYVLMASVADRPSQEIYPDEEGTHYYSVAASSDGKLAVGRQITRSQQVPPFLSDGVEALRSTSVPILVPPEEPQGTGGLVPSAEEHSYQLLFTNDPAGELAHVEQVNVFVSGTTGEPEPTAGPQSQRVRVRGTEGQFFCGASTCFLSWNELETNYTVGEFGATEEAVAFAEALVPIESLAGSQWREGKTSSFSGPELVVRERGGSERLLESARGVCECSFTPLDWSPENDSILVVDSAEGGLLGEGHATLHEYRADGSAEPRTLAESASDTEGRDLILDAAYGPDGVVVLFAGKGGPPGTLWHVDGGEPLADQVHAFDIEGSTLAYVNIARHVIVRDLSTGRERAVGEGSIDVSVAPDLISGMNGAGAKPEIDDGPSLLTIILVVVVGMAFLAAVALFLQARRRALD